MWRILYYGFDGLFFFLTDEIGFSEKLCDQIPDQVNNQISNEDGKQDW